MNGLTPLSGEQAYRHAPVEEEEDQESDEAASHRPATGDNSSGVGQTPNDTADDEDAATVSTRTEDDPVNLAMRAALDSDQEDEDEEEQILYPVQRRRYVILALK